MSTLNEVTSHQVTRSPEESKPDHTQKGYKKLIVWQKADGLAFMIYEATRKFPSHEIYGITSQLRRAALSIPTNLVEGCGRQGKRELKQFVNIALGSISEVEYLLDFCRRLGYLDILSYEKLENLRKETGSLCWKLYRSL